MFALCKNQNTETGLKVWISASLQISNIPNLVDHFQMCVIMATFPAERPDWFRVYLFPFRCLPSDTRSKALIWLPGRQQPFNNNAIVPHSSGPVSLIHPAVCRWYVVCDLPKHFPFLRCSPCPYPTQTPAHINRGPFLSGLFNSHLDKNGTVFLHSPCSLIS